jgi:hypothetical protein
MKSYVYVLLLAALLAAPALAQESPATPATSTSVEVPSAAGIVEKWRSYFESLQKLPAWSYVARMQVRAKESGGATAPMRLMAEIKVDFAKSGNMFRRELTVRESEKSPGQVITMAYNGTKYQMAVQDPEPEMIAGHPVRKLMLLSAKPFSDDPTSHTGFHLSLTMPFLFARYDINEVNFTELQKPSFWTSTQARITNVTPDTWQDYKGYTVTLHEKPAKSGYEHVEVFVEEKSGLPLRVRNINPKTQAVIGEIKTTQFLPGANGNPAFPLSVELSGDGPAKINDKSKSSGAGLITVEPASVSFAAADAKRFTVPLSSVEMAVENDAIVHSRFPLNAPKPATKTPAKAPAKPRANTKPRVTPKPRANTKTRSKTKR